MSRQGFTSEHNTDSNGNPAGGISKTNGTTVNWQNGPLGEGADRKEPNGAFVEDIIDIARDRIEYYQTESNGRFNCTENAMAITRLQEAVFWLNSRTQRRTEAGTEGTHRGS